MESEQVRAVIRRARAGSDEAYRELLSAYGPRLYGYFYRATGSSHDAEDLLGEVMLRVLRRLGDYDERGRFEPWLFRIAANLVRDRIRRWRTRPATASLEAGERGPLGDALSGEALPVDAGLIAAETNAAVNAALEKLDETSRQMVLLRHFAEMSYKEIAGVFDCPLGTVLAKVHRALKALRAALEQQDHGPVE
jgi:RNA polymerase sigma-70 factor (ECF subfamily)